MYVTKIEAEKVNHLGNIEFLTKKIDFNLIKLFCVVVHNVNSIIKYLIFNQVEK